MVNCINAYKINNIHTKQTWIRKIKAKEFIENTIPKIEVIKHA